ncbi:ABC transporter ATP-binding protein [Rothia koreensis]|jgi:ABC-type sugar transport system ATPase subunit|uniref:ABC transporter ATP-binding protein n=1 Tax=Rothia koreensis TaxID=592378 RepID=UPI0037C68ED9
MVEVHLQHISRIFDEKKRPAVNRVSLDVRDGEFLTLVGPSGSGKSTCLRMIAGLEPVDEGTVLIGGKDVTESRARDRNVAMVFQSYALYPNMTARQNMAFALENAKVPKAEVAARVDKVARMLELEDLLDSKPAAMSGGQRQRVSMGRAIVREPQVFLMDEPLSNLDARLRVSTRAQIASLQRELGVTTIYVTHDQTEAMTMGDRVAVLKDGELQQVDAPLHLYQYPGNTFVAGFIGSPSIGLFEAVPVDEGTARWGGVAVSLPEHLVGRAKDRVIVGVRPEEWDIAPQAPWARERTEAEGTETASEATGMRLKVEHIEQLGSEAYAYCVPVQESDVRLRGGRIALRVERSGEIEIGDVVDATPRTCSFFDAESEINLEYLGE